jgi:hypothetical protein
VKRPILLILGALSAMGGLVVSMGWLGTADIAHRGFDSVIFLLCAPALIYMALRPARPAGS